MIVGAAINDVAPAPVFYGICKFVPPAMFVAVVALVAVAALPPIDKLDAVPVNPVPAPAKPVAVKTPVDGKYCSLVELTYSVEIDPEVTAANNGYLADIVVVSSVIETPPEAFVHVGTLVPFEVNTCPVVPAAVNPVTPAPDCQGTAPATPPAKLVAVVAVDADPTDKVDCATYCGAVAPAVKTYPDVPSAKVVVVAAADW